MLTSYYEVLCLRKAKDEQEQWKWNRARWAVFHIKWGIPGKKTNWPRQVERMFPFPWDKKPTPENVDCTVTEDEKTAFMAVFKDFQARKKQQ